MFVARHCYFFKTYLLILWCIYEPLVEAVAPTFLVPIASTAPRDVDENSAKDVSILTVEGQDGDGDMLTFSIFSQNPMSPPFELESNTGLFKTPNGLDAETDQSFTFVFSVSDGTNSVDSVPFTVNINDLNDNTPQFVGTPYTASLLDSVSDGTSAVIVNATDADVTPATIIYSITGGNTSNTFAIDSNSGIITVAISANLMGGSSFTLDVQASDGTNSNTTTVTITVNVDYCVPNPCQNGGICTNGATTHTCTCPAGFTGTNCTETDFCASNPCKNGGICANGQNSYICYCKDDYRGIKCEICQVELCQRCCKCICQNCCGCILCCVLCLILSIGVSVACVIAATYILHRKKIINICNYLTRLRQCCNRIRQSCKQCCNSKGQCHNPQVQPESNDELLPYPSDNNATGAANQVAGPSSELNSPNSNNSKYLKGNVSSVKKKVTSSSSDSESGFASDGPGTSSDLKKLDDERITLEVS